MKLHELRVGQLRPGGKGHSHTVAGRDFGVRGVEEDLPGPARSQYDRKTVQLARSAHQWVQVSDAGASAVGYDQLFGCGVWYENDSSFLPRPSNQCANYFASSRIAVRVKDASSRM